MKQKFLFTFWRENKVANVFQLESDEVTRRFRTWLATRSQDWLEYYSTDIIVRTFIADHKGLNSVGKESEINDLLSTLKPAYKSYMSNLKIA